MKALDYFHDCTRKCSTACSHFDLINQCCWIASDAGLCTDAQEGDLCRHGFKDDSYE